MLLQAVALAAAVYLAFTSSWKWGLALLVASQALHWLCEIAAKFLMWVHEKLFISKFDRGMIMLSGKGPPAWLRISIAFGWMYVFSCAALIWYFLTR